MLGNDLVQLIDVTFRLPTASPAGRAQNPRQRSRLEQLRRGQWNPRCPDICITNSWVGRLRDGVGRMLRTTGWQSKHLCGSRTARRAKHVVDGCVPKTSKYTPWNSLYVDVMAQVVFYFYDLL